MRGGTCRPVFASTNRQMSDPIQAAFAHALAEIDRAERRGQRTRDGVPAAIELRRLRERLELARDAATSRGAVDAGEIGTLVREVAAWYPDDQIQLIAALGAIVRASTADS